MKKRTKRCPRGCIPAAPSYEWSGSDYAGLGGVQSPEARALWLAKQISKWSPAGRRMQGDELRQWRVRHFIDALARESLVLTSEDYKRLAAIVTGGRPLPGFAPGLGHSDEPDEDDITTGDHHRWYQSGKLYFIGDEAGLRAKMEQDHFFPNAWFISDHGNAHLIEV